MELRRDTSAREEEPLVEESPYRMVPGNDRVCTRDVLRGFNRSMKMQPSPSQQRKKGSRWDRGRVSGHQITDFLVKSTGLDRVNPTSGNLGFYTSYLDRINEVHVRWSGHTDEENKRLEQFAQILREYGYTVLLSEENNVDWPLDQSRDFILGRRNRKFLRVAKFHRQQKQRQKR